MSCGYLHCFYVSYFVLRASYDAYYVRLVPTMNAVIQNYALIAKSQVPSIQVCTEICTLDTSCVTFFYNSKTRECQAHSNLLKPNSTDQRDENWRYYQRYAGKIFIYKDVKPLSRCHVLCLETTNKFSCTTLDPLKN